MNIYHWIPILFRGTQTGRSCVSVYRINEARNSLLPDHQQMWWAQHCWAFGSEELDELQDKCFPFSKWSWYCAAVIKEIRGQTNGGRFSRQTKWRRSQILEIHGRAQAVERLQIEGLMESFIFFLEEQKEILLEVRPVMGSLSVPWMIGEWIRRFDGKNNDSDKSVPVLISTINLMWTTLGTKPGLHE
jgi:hypothetical protein